MLPRAQNAGKALIQKQHLFMKMSVFTFPTVPNPSLREPLCTQSNGCHLTRVSSCLTATAFTFVTLEFMEIGRLLIFQQGTFFLVGEKMVTIYHNVTPSVRSDYV